MTRDEGRAEERTGKRVSSHKRAVYVPSSYSSCATDMHLEGFIPSRLEHSCCRVEVMKGAGDLRLAFLSVTVLTAKCRGSSSEVSHVITDCAISLFRTMGS
jgi:hypothetical protein